MNRVAALTTALVVGTVATTLTPSASAAESIGSLSGVLAHQPLGFEPNVGQAAKSAEFVARGAGYDIELTSAGMLQRVHASSAVSRVALLGANAHSVAIAEERLPGVINYLSDADRAAWHTDVPAFSRITYRGIYAGIDAVYHGVNGELEYDFEVSPGVDPGVIKMAFRDAAKLSVDASTGDLLVRDKAGAVTRHSRPEIFQLNGEQKVRVAGSYRLLTPRVVAFDVGTHDPRNKLIIDPTVTLTRFLYGTGKDVPSAIATDAAGNSYITGITDSASGFPSGAEAAVNMGKKSKSCTVSYFKCPNSAFVVKFSSDGTLMSTLLFGGSGMTTPKAIAVDAYNVYVAGGTTSPDITTAGGNSAYVNIRYDSNTPAGVERAFVTRFSLPLTSISLTTLLGSQGNSEGHGLFVDNSQQAYVVGKTCGGQFPVTTKNVLFAGCDAFVAKLDTYGYLNGGYATVIGGLEDDDARAVAVNSVGYAWVTGRTCSFGFPTSNALLNHGQAGVAKGAGGTSCTAFLTEFDATGSSFLYSMVIGGNPYTAPHDTYMDDAANAIVLDGLNGAYIAGTTTSPNFYTIGGVQPTAPCSGCETGFVTYISAGFTTIYSTYLGGSKSALVTGIAKNTRGDVYVTGETYGSDGLPGAPAVTPNPTAGFVTKLSGTLNTVSWTQFLGDSVNAIVAHNANTRLGSLITTLYTTGTRLVPGSAVTDDNEDGFLVTLSDSDLVVVRPRCCSAVSNSAEQ